MIEVRVRQQDCVNMRQVMKMKRWRGQPFRADGKTWQTNSDTWEEDGVCQNCDAKKIYKHCGMPQPGKCQLRVAPFRRLGFRKGRAIGRQLSIVHSWNRCLSQRRTLDPRGIGCWGACTYERNTASILVPWSSHLGCTVATAW